MRTLRIKIVLYYIFNCFRLKVLPWNYFQINWWFFNEKKWIFSKIEIEKDIPKKWKLKSLNINFPINDKKISQLENELWFPLFLKPEWWQNSFWIIAVKNKKELIKNLNKISKSKISYIAQQAANYSKEFELFFIKDPDDFNKTKLISWVESKNKSGIKQYINWVDLNTTYHNILWKLKKSEISKINKNINKLQNFKLWRIWLKADSINDLIEGNFEIFEINIFIPFPLHLLDKNISNLDKNKFIIDFTYSLAKLTKNINFTWIKKNIFFPKIKKYYCFKLQYNNQIWK